MPWCSGLGHASPHVLLSPRFGQFHLPLTLGQAQLLLRAARRVAMRAAHAPDVVR